MVRKDLFSSHTKTLSLQALSVCHDAVCEYVHLASTPLTIFFLLPFNRCKHIVFLLEDANITHDKAPVHSSQTKPFLSKAVLYSESIQRIVINVKNPDVLSVLS